MQYFCFATLPIDAPSLFLIQLNFDYPQVSVLRTNKSIFTIGCAPLLTMLGFSMIFIRFIFVHSTFQFIGDDGSGSSISVLNLSNLFDKLHHGVNFHERTD